MAPVILGPRCNRQVTCDSNPANDRSESAVAINPTDHYNLIGSSKRFTDPATYQFSLSAYASWDGGQSWTETGPLPFPATVGGQTVAGISDPTVAFDDLGNAYTLGLAFSDTAGGGLGQLLGMVASISTDKGRTWGPSTVVHAGLGDDKQALEGDTNLASPHHGNVYATWDGAGPGNTGSGVIFARTTNHGASWTGVAAQPTGSLIIPGAVFSTITIDSQGNVYVCALGNDGQGHSAIVCVVSIDGGNSFGPVQIAAAPITPIDGVPDHRFRAESIPTSCVTTGDHVVVAWADSRNGSNQVFYVRSHPNGNWPNNAAAGTLLTVTHPSPAGQQDFMPQLASTPDGTVGCVLYEYGPKTAGGPSLIEVDLLVSTNAASTFADRVPVTDQSWDPGVDLVTDEYGEGFIGDYFGFAASDLGFFPLWTDTRTGVQELFTSRLAEYPTDMLLRDNSSDTGTVPSPGTNHWDAPDLVVGYSAAAPPMPWASQPLIPGQDHFVWAKVSNLGTNQARNVRLAVTVGNFPGLLGMPGSEFRYPQDWYEGDWNTAALQNNHLYLGEATPVTIAAGASAQLLGPVTWHAADIPAEGTWHPCLLAEVRTDNDDSAGGPEGSPIQASIDACNPGSFFWGDNNVCQRNLTYAAFSLKDIELVEFPFVVGNPWGDARIIEVVVEQGRELVEAKVPVRLTLRRIEKVVKPVPEMAVTGAGSVAVAGNGSAAPDESRLEWRLPGADQAEAVEHERLVGARAEGKGWHLTHRRSSVAFAARPGALHMGVLSFDPRQLGERHTTVHILQRNDRRIVTGGVTLHVGPRDTA
jgi:hypothetical protein